MVRRSPYIPAKRPVWHTIGAALGAFAMGVQLVLAGWLIAQTATAASDLQADMVICAHDGAGAGGDSGTPSAPASHGQCAVCACLQSAKILAPPPEAPHVAIVRPRAETVVVFTIRTLHVLHVHSPYASRAPPVSA
ncbi:MAG TPA: DUF2946 family protein [Xanthobacteraceae bacterium]|jgi:hypothetical protein